MIYITQGHEKGIGLEVFFKSFLTLSPNFDKQFTLIVNSQTLLENLKLLKLNYIISPGLLAIQNRNLRLIEFNDQSKPQSTVALEIALKEIQHHQDTLITLPTSKDQLLINNQHCLGYTEYLRNQFNLPDLAMFFYSESLKVLLLTDHLQLKEVPDTLNENLVIKKVSSAIAQFKFNNIYFAGINPHAGEGGLLGLDDKIISNSIISLQKLYPQINFQGPFSGDVLHYKINSKENQLLVYSFHDQGLVLFKSQQSLMGINITLGLPFLRLSVDHGTGFDIYGKNQANYLGCFYTLKKALEFQDSNEQ